MPLLSIIRPRYPSPKADREADSTLSEIISSSRRSRSCTTVAVNCGEASKCARDTLWGDMNERVTVKDSKSRSKFRFSSRGYHGDSCFLRYRKWDSIPSLTWLVIIHLPPPGTLSCQQEAYEDKLDLSGKTQDKDKQRKGKTRNGPSGPGSRMDGF